MEIMDRYLANQEFDDTNPYQHNSFNLTGFRSDKPESTLMKFFFDSFSIGSGANTYTFYSNCSGSSIVDLELVGIPVRRETYIPIKQVQDRICKAFSLTRGELASCCQVSRKTLYDWEEGSVPRPNKAERLFQLYRAANDWLDASQPIAKPRLREPLLMKKSLFDLLAADNIDLDAIAFLRCRIDLDTIDDIEPLE